MVHTPQIGLTFDVTESGKAVNDNLTYIDNFSNIVIIVILICPGFLLIFCDVFYITSIIIICLYSKFILNLLASLADLRWPLRWPTKLK